MRGSKAQKFSILALDGTSFRPIFQVGIYSSMSICCPEVRSLLADWRGIKVLPAKPYAIAPVNKYYVTHSTTAPPTAPKVISLLVPFTLGAKKRPTTFSGMEPCS